MCDMAIDLGEIAKLLKYENAVKENPSVLEYADKETLKHFIHRVARASIRESFDKEYWPEVERVEKLSRSEQIEYCRKYYESRMAKEN